MMVNFNQLYNVLNENASSIISVTDNIDKHYFNFQKAKTKLRKVQHDKEGAILYRNISSPSKQLKSYQRNLLKELRNITLPACMYGSIPGKNNILNALKHIENKFFLSIDLKDFFPNISHNQVHQSLIENGIPWEIARVITKLTTSQKSLPQGSPTSAFLANVVLKNLVITLSQIAQKHKITFTCFLDDFTFSSKTSFKHLIPQIIKTINDNNFVINYKKVHYRHNKCEVTGLMIDNGKLKLIPDMKTRIEHNPHLKEYFRIVSSYYHQYLRH